MAAARRGGLGLALGRLPRFTNALIAGALLVAVVLVAWVAYSRITFGSWNPLGRPNRIDYCGRRYYPQAHVTLAQIKSQGNGLGNYPVTQVGISPAGEPIYAKPLPDSVRHQFPNAGVLPCDMAVFLKVGSDDYVAYVISGGP